MNVVEKFGVPEPQWILDRAESGGMFWRRHSPGKNPRVKFLVEVEIKEFSRSAHELEDVYWLQEPKPSILTMGMTALFCITFTVLLPWFLIGIEPITFSQPTD